MTRGMELTCSLTLALVAVLVSGCGSPDDASDQAAAESADPEAIPGDAEDVADDMVDDGGSKPVDESEPVDDLVVEDQSAVDALAVDEWAPGDPDDYIDLALGPRGGDDVVMANWLDCRNVAPILDDMDYLVACDIPVDGEMIDGWLFDWYGAFDFDALVELEGGETAQAQSAVLFGGHGIMAAWVETWCDVHSLDRVYVVSVAPGQPIAFPGAGDADADRFDAAEQVSDWVNRASAIVGLDPASDVDVRRCD